MKRLMPAIICLFLLLFPALSVFAASPRIVDEAGLLSEAQILELEETAQRLADTYGMDVVIVTVNSLEGKSSEAFADDYYDEHGYGIGSDYSGVLLLLSMEYRDWAISTCGETIHALNDYGIQDVFAQISPYLAQDLYYEAFCVYLAALEPYLKAYESGSPMDGYAGEYEGPGTYIPGTQDIITHYEETRGFSWYMQRFLIALIIGAVAAGIVLLVMRAGMNTAKAQHGAGSYMLTGSYRVEQHRDMFLYSQVHKVRKAENNSGGGGSSVHRSSSGRSHGGGHGKF